MRPNAGPVLRRRPVLARPATNPPGIVTNLLMVKVSEKLEKAQNDFEVAGEANEVCGLQRNLFDRRNQKSLSNAKSIKVHAAANGSWSTAERRM